MGVEARPRGSAWRLASITTSFGLEAYSAIAVSVLALGNGLGRAGYGKLSDSFGRKPVIIFALALQAVLLLIRSVWPIADCMLSEAGKRVQVENSSTGVLVLVPVMGFLVGADYGANLAVSPATTKDFLGLQGFRPQLRPRRCPGS